MKLWKFIEEHHEDFGAALFILPCLLATFSIAGVEQRLKRRRVQSIPRPASRSRRPPECRWPKNPILTPQWLTRGH